MSGRLRCWPGCIAYVERANCPQNVGATVEVLSLDEPLYGEPCWRVRPSRPAPAINELFFDVRLVSEGYIPDAWLRPITPPPGTETEDTTTPTDATQGAEMLGA